MSSAVRAVVPVVYVTDPERSCAFYELIGLARTAEGRDADWRWVLLQSGELSMMIAAGDAALPPDAGPAVLYCVVPDLDAVRTALTAAGHVVDHLGYPDHAPGGEARAVDPDGHGVMLGQTTGVPGKAGPPTAGSTTGPADPERGSLLQVAADAVRRRGGADRRCQIGRRGGVACDADAEVKLADSWGDTAWSCLLHADEVLVDARGVFIATEDAQGLEQYLRLRRMPRATDQDAR
jgi:predicted enzyme related to lactoylglutathione lyase